MCIPDPIQQLVRSDDGQTIVSKMEKENEKKIW
jgi:hypothetical protein